LAERAQVFTEKEKIVVEDELVGYRLNAHRSGEGRPGAGCMYVETDP
jgi:hypothetical protein